ncbi:MAG TPA: TOMM precursor leader peptide-binding protein [Actinophytocola sp.]|jgi:ribosomal protein S12 methylthiotransferase accessory factor|uniref:TOMM precursor leader peptide-binding protein n=1 Tax=Actinophytocola sp. TaxID=1872138 RepID=UPI002F92BA98
MTGTELPPVVGFRRHLRTEVAGEVTYLFSERGMTTLRGAEVSTLAPLLDGTRSLESLLEDAPGGMVREDVAAVIAQLTDAGLVTVQPPVAERADEPALAYWDSVGLPAAEAVAGTTTKSVAIFTVGDVDTVAAWSAFRSAGLAVTAGLPLDPVDLSVDLPVVLCDDYLSPCLGEMSEALQVAGIPWLLAKPGGTQVWIGPFFEPGSSGCWYCLASRLRLHRQAESCASDELGRTGPVPHPLPAVPPLSSAAMDLVALEATKWLGGQRYAGQRSVWVMDATDLTTAHHELRGRPPCEHCGDAGLVSARANRPITLTSRPKAAGTGGGHRALPLEDVRAEYAHLVSPVTGVLKEIRRDRRGPAVFHSYRSGQNAALGVRTLDALNAALRAENGGKGTTALEAEVGALCEAVERYSGAFHGDEQRIRGSLRSLGERAVDPGTCLLFHDRQFRDRTGWNAEHSPFQHVCDPFDADAEMDWTSVWSLTGGRHRLLPTALLYYGAPAERGPRFLHADSNGNAAGTSIEDAILQGALELVERDAVALWWYNRTPMPGVDLGSFGDSWLDDVRAAYAGLRRELWVLDITSDLGVPAMAAISRRIDGPREDIMFGFGAHLDPRIAVRRAVSELNQLIPAMLGRGDRYDCDDPDAVRWWREATVAGQPYLVPDAGVAARTPTDYGYVPRTDLLDDVRTVHDRIAAQGMEMLVLDQTRPDVGMPVVKVVVPGMRHMWARFGPGRLYDVPVRLGRLTSPTPYDELNPYPMFL